MTERVRKAGIVVTVMLAATVAGCGSSHKASDTTRQSSATTVAQSSPTTVAGALSIKNFTFEPTPLEVAAGSVVTVANRDTATHTVTADNAAFDTGEIPAGSTASFKVGHAGTVAFHCNIHTYMKGTITVT